MLSKGKSRIFNAYINSLKCTDHVTCHMMLICKHPEANFTTYMCSCYMNVYNMEKAIKWALLSAVWDGQTLPVVARITSLFCSCIILIKSFKFLGTRHYWFVLCYWQCAAREWSSYMFLFFYLHTFISCCHRSKKSTKAWRSIDTGQRLVYLLLHT